MSDDQGKADWRYNEARKRIREARVTARESLDLSNLELVSVPETISSLPFLSRLDLSDNLLENLPSEVGELHELTVLNLSANRFSRLPDALQSLGEVEWLDLSGNSFCELPDWLGALDRLTLLSLSSNRFAHLPDMLSGLRKMERLMLSNNLLQRLPVGMREWRNLRYLHAPHNWLTALPDWLGQMHSLRLLDLSNNALTTLPPSLRGLTELEALYLHNNPSLGLPPAVLGPKPGGRTEALNGPRSPATILDYYFRIHPPAASEKRPAGEVLRELKIILLGRGEVGKSSLVDVLLGNEFITGRARTEGIAITPWPLALADGPATARVWDFGGQEIMHGTHQFFLTHRSLYLVVVDSRHDRHKQDAEHWLKYVRAFGGESPVIVVLNKQKGHAYDTDRQYLIDKYKVAPEHFFRTDCADAASIDNLRTAIKRAAAWMLTPAELFPPEWSQAKTRLGAMKEHGEDYLSEPEYEVVCRECGVGADDYGNLLRRLAQLGSVVSFPDEMRLRELTVLNPEWATDGIYRILNDDALQDQRHGQLPCADLTRILPVQRWPVSRHRYLVDLMRQFELCFPLEDERETVLVPDLLPDRTPPLDRWNAAECLVLLYKYPVLPHGLMARFITRTHSLSTDRERWRSGVVLALEGAEAVVRADYDRNEMSAWVRGEGKDGRRALLTVARQHFAAIHARIEELRPEERVALPGHPEVTEAYDALVKDEREGVTQVRVTVQDRREWRDISEFLNGVETPADRKRRQKEEESRFGGGKSGDTYKVMGNIIQQNFNGGTFHAQVAAVMKNCDQIINAHPSGERKDLLETLSRQVSEAIGGPADEKVQLKKTVANRLNELTEGMKEGAPDRVWYSVTAKGLLDAAKFVKDFTGEIGGTLTSLGKSIWPTFTLAE